MTYDEFRDLFPSSRTCIHLNHAGVSPIARPVADSVQKVTGELMSDDCFVAYKNHMRRQENLRAAFGRLMNVAPGTLGFVRNTSHGITIAAQALPFAAGDVVILPAGEYPANVYPWMAQAWRGVAVRTVPTHGDGILSEDDLIAACEAEPRARALAVSWVQWGTGQRLDLQRLGEFCRGRGLWFVVDLVQGLGALRPDLGSLPVDIATAGCHKWLLAPGGAGVLYVREGLGPSLLPTNVGWNSVEEPIDWERLHWDEMRTTPERFEEGTPGVLAVAALGKSVELLEGVGFDAVNDRVLALADYARQALAGRGCRVISPAADPAQRSGIIAFRHASLDNDAVLAALTEKKVRAAVRCGNVRFAPHAYNTEADIDAAVAAVPA